MSKQSFYITTTLPYVNAEPHIGFAMEIIRADIIARAKKLAGHDVFLNTGTDEHGIKIHQRATRDGIDTQTYVDGVSLKFKELLPKLGIMPEVNFIRTTDSGHVVSAQAFWKIVEQNGQKDPDGPYIYKKHYSVRYCIGCELEKTDSELVDGKCPLHPLQDLETIQEENYFFKFSAFSKKLLDLYENNPRLVIPDFRFNEIKSFVRSGLQDFSISRLASKMPWGVPVPGDESQVMYVWFDALVNYISAVGWPDRQDDFKKWCIDSGGMIQYCGKDNLRQQSAMWQAMLMAAGLPPSQSVIINGFITGDGGLKMSKSLGNTVDPIGIVDEYGADALRYYVAKEISPFEDSPFTMDKFKETYNAGLANGIGNLTSRIMKMAVNEGVSYKDGPGSDNYDSSCLDDYDNFNIQKVCQNIWSDISRLDEYIQREQPFKKVKDTPEAGKKDIVYLLNNLMNIAVRLEPIIPETSLKIRALIKENKMPEQPLFARK